MEPLNPDEILYEMDAYHVDALKLDKFHPWGPVKRIDGRPVSATTYILGGLSHACKSTMAVAVAKHYYNARVWRVNKPEDLASIKAGKIRKGDVIVIDEFNTTGCLAVEMKNLVNREQANHIKVRYTSSHIPYGVTLFITTNRATLEDWVGEMNSTAAARRQSGWTDSCMNVRIKSPQT